MGANREARRIELAMMLLAMATAPGHREDELAALAVRLAVVALLGVVEKALLVEFHAVYRNTGLPYGNGSLPAVERAAALIRLQNGIEWQARARLDATRSAKAVREGTKEFNDRREWQRRYHG